jgi:hypothetical protein
MTSGIQSVTYGPFEVKPQQIEDLETAFTEFINKLLIKECASAGMLGHELRIDNLDEAQDRGVDAQLINAEETAWIPSGQSAWQFKRSDLGPKACKDELAGALFAHELIQQGASYRLVLGKRLKPYLKERRRSALIEQALLDQLIDIGQEARIQVYDANDLARWASKYPSLAICHLLGGLQANLLDYDRWSESIQHQYSWVPTEGRDQVIAELQDIIKASDRLDVRVVGNSGIGKTRLVMEMLRDDLLKPLVVYVGSDDQFTINLLYQLTVEERVAIIVVDNCSGEKHKLILEHIPHHSTLNLVTLGEKDGFPLRTPVKEIGALSSENIGSFLKSNYSELQDELRDYIAYQSGGNIGFAIIIAERIKYEGQSSAAGLHRLEDHKGLVKDIVAEAGPFFVSTVLALLKRVGWDRELRYQLEVLADYSGFSVAEFEAVGQLLEKRGLLERQGRYRVILLL